MPILVSCPHCAKKYRLKDDKRGKKVLCRACESTFRAGPKVSTSSDETEGKAAGLTKGEGAEKEAAQKKAQSQTPAPSQDSPVPSQDSIHTSSPFLDLEKSSVDHSIHVSSPFLDLDVDDELD